jgi:membrane protein DedA with SNARE-associated domain
MDELLQMLVRHGYLFLPIFVFLDQIGLPLPAAPVLLGAGALAGLGQLDPGLCLGLVVAAALISDVVRYEAGRRWGGPILGLLCRISLEPDSCVRRTEETFGRHGLRSLLVAKFVPGLNAVAPTLAGLFRARRGAFLGVAAAGSLLWGGTFLGLGYLFSDHLERIAASITGIGASLGAILAGGLALYLLWKFVQRRRFIGELRIARISAHELRTRLAAGEAMVVVDLRHGLEAERDPDSVPGAIRMSPEALADRHHEIPRDREVVLLCT